MGSDTVFMDILLLFGIVILFSMCIKKVIKIIKVIRLYLYMRKEDNVW